MKNRLIAGGAAALAVTLTIGIVGTSVPTVASLPAQPDHVVAAGVTNRVAELEAEAAARAAAEAAAAEAAAKAEAEAKAKAEAEAKAKAQTSAKPSRPSGSTSNDRGIADSAYTGSYYNAAHEATRKCIVRKESGGNYGIVSSNGMYHGAYQFSRSTGDATARKMGRSDLVGTPVSKWSRAEQDQAFWTLWNHGAGRGNWPTARGC